jgi:hypothetical protein
LRKEGIETESRKLLLKMFQFFASEDVIEFQTTDTYAILDLINVKYDMNIHSRDENLKVPLGTKPSNLIQQENVKVT